MARYIDADWIYEKVENRYRVSSGIEHRCERDLLDLICEAPTADVVPKSEEGEECPTCHGTGRIGTTNWLTKNISKKQLAEEKAKAIAAHEQYIKTEVAREIFEEIDSIFRKQYEICSKTDLKLLEPILQGERFIINEMWHEIAELKKKYTGDK